MRSYQRLGLATAWVALVLGWLIPNHYAPCTSFYNDSAAAVAVAALLVVATEPRSPVGIPLTVWILLTVAMVPLTQWALGLLHFSGDAIVASAYIVGVSLSLFAGYAFSESGYQRSMTVLLSGAALFAAVVSSAIAVSQAFGLTGWGIWAEFATPDMRAMGNLAQPNNLATLLGLGILGALYLYESRRLQGTVTLSLALLVVFPAALTQSRVSLLFGTMVLTALWVSRRRGLSLKTPWQAVAALTLMQWLLMVSLPYLQQALFGAGPKALADRGVGSFRYQMWRMLLAAANEAPWAGYGWLQVGAAELAVVDRYPPITELWLHGHNLLLELVLWCGWPLGIALGATLIAWFVKRLLQVRTLESTVGMLVGSFVGLHAMVELPHHYAYFLFPVALWAGIVESDVGAAASGQGRWMFIPAGAALAVFLGFWSVYPALEEDFRKVRFEGARIDLSNVRRVSIEAPLMSSLTAFLRFSRTLPVANMTDAQLEEMRRVTFRYPYAPSLVRYATALALNGQTELACKTFVKVRYVFGDGTYRRFQADLHDKVAQGQAALAALYDCLPRIEPTPLEAVPRAVSLPQ